MTDTTLSGNRTTKEGGRKTATATAQPAADADPAIVDNTGDDKIGGGAPPAGAEAQGGAKGDMVFVEAPTHEDSAQAAPPWSYPGKGGPYRGIARTPAGNKPAVLPVKAGPIGAPSLPSFGLPGRRRSAIAVVALSVITLGIYALLWHERINSEMGDFDTRMHVHPAKSTIPVVIAWLLGVLVSVAGAVRIVLAVLNISLPFDPGFSVVQAYFLLAGIAAIPYIMLAFPFSLVAITMTLERVRILEDRVGRTTDVQLRPALAICWLLVPVIGGLILLASIQRRLNRTWELAQTPILTGRLSRAS